MWKSFFVQLVSITLLLVSNTLGQENTIDHYGSNDRSVNTSLAESSARLIFNSERKVVNPGEMLNLECGVEGEYRSCIWEKGDDNQQHFQVEDVHTYSVSWMSKPENTKGNECGIIINYVTSSDTGNWTCKVFVIGKTLKESKTVFVTDKPHPPTLDINKSILDRLDNVTYTPAKFIFNRERIVANPREKLYLDCGVQGEYRSCIWELNGDRNQTFQVEDVDNNYVSGISRPLYTKGNECGIVLDYVSPNDNGKWTCKVFVITKTFVGSKTVLVPVRPQPPTLKIIENILVISEKERRDIKCTVAAARPAARIRWYIGTKDVSARAKTENVPTDVIDVYRSISVLRYRFFYTDDTKKLKCLIEHLSLHEPAYAEIPLDIRHKPYPISSTEIYGVTNASVYEIKLNFTSNPKPKIKFNISGEEVPVPSEKGRYLANIKSLKKNIYMATLKIRGFSLDDVMRTYKLTARNDLGENIFDIFLSTETGPPGDNSPSYCSLNTFR